MKPLSKLKYILYHTDKQPSSFQMQRIRDYSTSQLDRAHENYIFQVIPNLATLQINI